MRKLFVFQLWLFCLNLVFTSNLWAYQDLGSGSYFIQVILAALFGLSFYLSKYWKKVKSFLGRMLKGKKDPNGHHE